MGIKFAVTDPGGRRENDDDDKSRYILAHQGKADVSNPVSEKNRE